METNDDDDALRPDDRRSLRTKSIDKESRFNVGKHKETDAKNREDEVEKGSLEYLERDCKDADVPGQDFTFKRHNGDAFRPRHKERPFNYSPFNTGQATHYKGKKKASHESAAKKESSDCTHLQHGQEAVLKKTYSASGVHKKKKEHNRMTDNTNNETRTTHVFGVPTHSELDFKQTHSDSQSHAKGQTLVQPHQAQKSPRDVVRAIKVNGDENIVTQRETRNEMKEQEFPKRKMTGRQSGTPSRPKYFTEDKKDPAKHKGEKETPKGVDSVTKERTRESEHVTKSWTTVHMRDQTLDSQTEEWRIQIQHQTKASAKKTRRKGRNPQEQSGQCTTCEECGYPTLTQRDAALTIPSENSASRTKHSPTGTHTQTIYAKPLGQAKNERHHNYSTNQTSTVQGQDTEESLQKERDSGLSASWHSEKGATQRTETPHGNSNTDPRQFPKGKDTMVATTSQKQRKSSSEQHTFALVNSGRENTAFDDVKEHGKKSRSAIHSANSEQITAHKASGKTHANEALEKTNGQDISEINRINDASDKTRAQDASDKTRAQDTSEKTRAQDASEKTRAQDASDKTRAQDASEKTRAQDALVKTRAQDAPEKTRAQDTLEKTRAQDASETTKAQYASKKTRNQDAPGKTRAQDASKKTRAQDTSEKTRAQDASKKTRAQDTSDKTRAQDASEKTRAHDASEKTRAQETSKKTRAQDASEKTRAHDASEKTRAHDASEKKRAQDASDKTRAQDASEKTRVHDASEKTRAQDASEKTRAQDASEKTRAQDTSGKAKAQDASEKTRAQDTSEKTRAQDASEKTRTHDASEKTRAQDASDKTRAQDASEKTRTHDASEKTRAQDASDKTRAQDASEKTRTHDASEKTRTHDASEKTRTQDASEKIRAQDTSDKTRVHDTSDKTKALNTSDKKRAQETSDKTRVQDASDGKTANNTSEKLKVPAAPEKLDSNDSPIRPASTEQSLETEIKGNTITIHLGSRKPRTYEENSKQAMFHAVKMLSAQHGTLGDTKTDKIMQDDEHQQERGTSSQSVDATARKVTKRKADSSKLPTTKQAMEIEMHDFLVKIFPGLHKQTYFVPPILFNVAKRTWATQFHGCFKSELTPQSNVRADEARERILKCLQELSTTMTCVVMSGVIFDEYLNKRTRLSTDKPGEKSHIPFPKPGDLASQYRRGEVDVMIFDKSHGIIILDVKAIGDTFDEMSLDESEKLDLIIKVLEKALALIRKEREVILHLVSDIPCTIPVSAMLVLPNLSRSLLKDALDLQPVLREQLAKALRTTRRVEDVCLCADDLPAKHQAMTDENVRNFAQCWKQQFPDKKQVIDDGVYEQIIGRFCGPFSSVTVWTSEQQRAIVRTLGQAVHETGRRFTAPVLFPQHIEVLDSNDKYVYINGPPGSGKTLVLTVKGEQWVKAGSYVCVLTKEAGTSPVSLIIHHQIVDALDREEDTSCSGKIDTDSLSNDTDDVKTRYQHLVNRLKQRAEGRLICLIVDEIDVADFPALEIIIDQLPECQIWCAGIWAANGPQRFVLKQLPISFRCPPAVQTILQLTEPSVRKAKPSLTSDVTSPTLYTYVTDSTQIDECPLPTTGARAMLMSHANHGSGTILDCSLCGEVLAAYLKDNLRVGTDIPASDILIVTADTQRLSSSQNVAVFPFVKALEKQGMEVNIIARYSGNKLAFPSEAEVTLTSYEFVAGLERMVVVFLPGGTPASVDAENEVSKVCYNDVAAIATCTEFTGSNAKCHPMETDDKPEGDVSKSEVFTGQATQQLSQVTEEIAVVNNERKANTKGENKAFDPYEGDDEEKGKEQTGDRTTLHKEGYKLQPTEVVPGPNRNEDNHSSSNTDDSKEISTSPSPAKEEQSSQGTSQVEKHKGTHARKGSPLQRPPLKSFEHQTGSTDKKRKSRRKNTRKGKSSKHKNHDKSQKENIYDLVILNPSEGEDDENENGYDCNTSDSSEEKREVAENRKPSFAKEVHSSQGTGQTEKHKSAHSKKGCPSPRDALGSLENQKGLTDKKSRGKNAREGKSSKRGNLLDESHRKISTSGIDQENVFDLKKRNPSDEEDDENDKSCDHNTSDSLEEKRQGAEDKTFSEAISSKGSIKANNITDNCRKENKTEHVASTNSEKTTAYASRPRQTSPSKTQDQVHVPTPGAAALSLATDIRTCIPADDDVGFRTVGSSQPSRQECSPVSISEGTTSSLEQGMKEVQVNDCAEDRTEKEADLDAGASANRPVEEKQMRSYDSRLHEAVNQLSVSNRECMWYAVSCARAHVVIFHFPQN